MSKRTANNSTRWGTAELVKCLGGRLSWQSACPECVVPRKPGMVVHPCYPGAGKGGLWGLMESGKDERVGGLKLRNHKNVTSKIILQTHRNNEFVLEKVDSSDGAVEAVINLK